MIAIARRAHGPDVMAALLVLPEGDELLAGPKDLQEIVLADELEPTLGWPRVARLGSARAEQEEDADRAVGALAVDGVAEPDAAAQYCSRITLRSTLGSAMSKSRARRPSQRMIVPVKPLS